ncbi:TldD/PmbA family protein [Clostridium sp. 'deep sea']|uniref:TldD/PmbA family protein n=1 Tax=Clostridium sp. 'deep sea' TaxID=2779445 RepID=UPI00189641F6|nr:metallopeptidase TldD-related protein [Clostridium sp. 'deep sea']QOR36087.1 TldD/PmbA family protein [Clostridium sp. 'deep sea']
MVSEYFIRKIIKRCNTENITDVEVYYHSSQSASINVLDGEVQKYELANNEGINIRGNYQDRYSETYIEQFHDKAITEAIKNIKSTAVFNNKKAKKSYLQQQNINDRNIKISDTNIDLVIQKLKETQDKAYTLNAKISSVPVCSYYENKVSIVIFNEKGIELKNEYKYTVGSITVVASELDNKKSGCAKSIKEDFTDIDYDALLEDAIYEATSMLSASPIKTGKYKVILKNSVVADIFSCFLDVFKIDSIEKGSSNLKGQENKKIAVTELNLFEDPDSGIFKRTFDDEGTETFKKYLIHNGELKNILTNASHKPKRLTGNAFRNSYKSNIAISALNCYIEKGSKTTEEIILSIDNGVMITNIDGLHAGINTVTGDFSLISNGYYIKNGKLVQAINQVTTSGNFYDLLYNILDISCDVKSSIINGSYFESPSLLIQNLMIGGL